MRIFSEEIKKEDFENENNEEIKALFAYNKCRFLNKQFLLSGHSNILTLLVYEENKLNIIASKEKTLHYFCPAYKCRTNSF